MKTRLRDFKIAAPIFFAPNRQPEASVSSPYAAVVSVDVSDAEAKDVLACLRYDEREAPAAFLRDGRVHAIPMGPDALQLILHEMEDRFLMGFHDRRPFIETVVTDLVFAPAWPIGDDEDARTRAGLRLRTAIKAHLADDRKFAGAVTELERVLAAGDPSALFAILKALPADPGLEGLLTNRHDEIAEHWALHRPTSLSALLDPNILSVSLCAHEGVWGCRHRHIAMTCASGPFPDACVPEPKPLGSNVPWQYQLPSWHGPYFNEGFWAIWRTSRELEMEVVGNSPALRLAELLAGAAVFVKDAGDRVPTTIRSAFQRNYYGPVLFFDELKDHTAACLERRAAVYSQRDMRWSFDCEQEDHRMSDASRLSHRIQGADIGSARDRLLLKLLGRGLGAGAILPLRIETLEVREFDDLFDLSWSGEMPILKMCPADARDFWILVGENHGFEGFLLSRVEDNGTYGRIGLSRADLDSIVSARAREFPLAERELVSA